jgi:hypothetical protein
MDDFEQEKVERLRRAMYSRSLSDKLKERPRRELTGADPLVGEEWAEHEEGLDTTRVAPRVIRYTRKALFWFLGFSIAFFVIALGFFIYYFTFGAGSAAAAPANIDISISGPPQIAGGEPTKLQIEVTNRNKVSLELADLVISYPEGTRSPLDFQTDFPSQRISLGTIEPGGRRQGTVTAVFSGQSGVAERVNVELEYRVRGSSAVFVAEKEYNLVLSTSPLSLSIDGNTQTISGQPMQFTINIASNASAPMKDVLVQIAYPFGFRFGSSSLKPISEGLWVIGDLAPGERKSMQVSGTLSGESGDQRVFRISAGTRPSTDIVGISNVLANNAYAMQISQTFLGLTVTANKQSGNNVVAAPGENVTVTVTYKNNLSTQITDAIIVARLSGLSIDGSTVHSIDGFYRSTDETVLWDKSTTGGALASLAPGAPGTLSFSFQMPSSEQLQNIVNPKLAISINAAGKRISESGVPQSLQSTVRQEVRLATDLQLNSQALYYANPFASTGPMPPKAGTETTYALVFTITNTTNKLSGAKVTATLPPYVRWIGSYAPASEKLTFNQTDGTFTWDVGDIGENVGVGGNQPRQIAIAIGLTPSTSQIGQQPALVHNVTLTATDETAEPVNGRKPTVTKRATPDVTTNLAQVGKSSSDAIVGTDPGFSPANASVVK